jgi:proteasome lid subunit RPN8/RPN11
MDSLRFVRPDSLKLTPDQWEQMQLEVEQLSPEEACGLLAGKDGQVQSVIPIPNVLHSPVLYRMDPQKQLDAFLLIDNENMDLLGIYHSHPHGPNAPSPTDIAEAYYPEAVYLIWSHASGEWKCQGFSIQHKKVQEVVLIVT